MYTCRRREGWRPSKHGSQHAYVALAIDVGLGVSTRASEEFAVFVQMGGSAQPQSLCVRVCMHPTQASPLNMGLILQTPRQP